MTQWVADQKAAGQTDEQIKAHLATFDVLDRNDYDGDGGSTSPTATSTASRSCTPAATRPTVTRSRARTPSGATAGTRPASTGVTGPEFNRAGGTEIGTTGLWVGDYTIQAENGGLSTIAHEYGHDLGLPDHYDTAASATTRSAGGR